MVGGAAETNDGSAGSTGAAGAEGDTDLDGVAIRSVDDATVAPSSVPQASWEGREEEIVLMGSEGSTGAELDSGRIGVRETTHKVLTSSELTGSDEEGSATLGCASAGAGISVGATSYTTMLMIFRSIRR